ncbi:F-box/WD repeat-containing protein 2 [Amphibalanus amphitrite]|uniref:F-box/WD repeat-containing protein 2 n=1 Tax=Amphibalanus amphitrite TaxID=1232801 RepID=A0A6A4WET7_AMPAM|nr:F-box/WD repeat-containing protein 2 [Amphibalanus amphitrite]
MSSSDSSITHDRDQPAAGGGSETLRSAATARLLGAEPGAEFAQFVDTTLARYTELNDQQQTAFLESLIAHSQPRQRWYMLHRLPSLLLRDFLTLLPAEIVEHMLSYVDGASLLRCCQVCHAWNRIISGLPALWRQKCHLLGTRTDLGSIDLEAVGGWKELFLCTQRTLWRMKTRQAFEKVSLKLPAEHGGKVIALDHHGDQLVAASELSQLFVWRLSEEQCVLTFSVFLHISCLKFTQGKFVVCGHYNGQLSSYDISDTAGDPERAERLQERLRRAASPDEPEERSEAAARLLRRFWVHSGPVFCLDYSEELDILVSGSADNTVKIFSLSSGLLLNTLPRHSHWVVRVLLRTGLQLSPAADAPPGRLLLTMTRDEIQVFEVENCPPWLGAEPFKSLRTPRLTVPLAETQRPQPGMHIPFFTPGCHLHGDLVTFVRQSPPTNNKISTASIVQYSLRHRSLSTRIVVSFKVKKLLAIGRRYAILLAPYAQESCPNLYFVNLNTKEVIASEKVPHSRLSTPDAAQLAMGELGWLDGFDGEPPEGGLIAAMGTELSRERCCRLLQYGLLACLLPPLLNHAALQTERQHLRTQVVLDSPAGLSSDVWLAVLPRLSELTRTCVFDRPGLGFSDRPMPPGERDRQLPGLSPPAYTAGGTVADLHRLLTQVAPQPLPLVYVGAGLGALNARLYAHLYPSEVSDLVLVAPMTEELLADGGPWLRHVHGRLLAPLQTLHVAAATGLTRLMLMFGLMEAPLSEAAELLGEEAVNRQKHLMCHPRHASTVVDEHHFLNETAAQLRQAGLLRPLPTGRPTVTVITGDRHDGSLPAALNDAWAAAARAAGGKLETIADADGVALPYLRPEQLAAKIRRVAHERRTRLGQRDEPVAAEGQSAVSA